MQPKRVRHPTDRWFTFRCSPPCLAATQLLQVSGRRRLPGGDLHPSDSAPRRRTRSGPCPRWQEGNGRGGHRLRRTPERPGLRSRAETWEQSNVVASGSPVTRWKAGPARRTVRGRTGIRGSKQSFGAEPVGGVRNREKGANCLSAASFCPAGSAARRPGSSQRQGCPFFWFFSLGRQRKERHPAGGRWVSVKTAASVFPCRYLS